MAEDKKVVEKGAADDKPPAGKKKLLLIIIVVLLVLIGAGGGVGYSLLAHRGADPNAPAKHEAPPPKKPDAPPVFAKLDTFVVNLAGGSSSLLQVDMQAELANADAQKQLTDYMPKVRSAVILLLSAKTVDEIRTHQGKLKLKNQIKAVINGAMDSGTDEPVKGVLFTSFIIQNS